MYETFFNLRKKPFELVPDPDFIYMSGSHKRALTYLDYGIRERAGFILLTGDVGSGKTTLIRELLNKHYENVVLAKVFNTRVTTEQLLSMINDDFGLAVAGKDKVSLTRDLNDFLLEQYAVGNQPILIIDEAQNLDADKLEEIRLLSNLESSNCKLMQIILVGQPELRSILSAPGLLQLRQRISINCQLRPLTRQEASEYLYHRMEVAGNGTALVFPEGVIDLIFKYSRGIPRLINILCEFILLAAFAEESKDVSVAMVDEVVTDLDFENYFWGIASPETTRPESARQPSTIVVQLPQAVQSFLAAMAQRLDSIEKGSGAQASALKKVCEALTMLRGELTAQVNANKETTSELRSNVASIYQTLENLKDYRTHYRPPATGFARRLIDGMTGCNGKKW